MSDLLRLPYCGLRRRPYTIRQERDLSLALAQDEEATRSPDLDLRLLDDAAIGRAGISEYDVDLLDN
jgi:hypothetical protein